MLNNVFLKTLRDMRTALMWWMIGMFVFSLYYMAMYPTFENNNADMQEMMDNMPQGVKALFGMEDIDMTSVEGFIAMEAYGFFFPLMLLAFAVPYGAGLIGSEEDNTTFDLLLAVPKPRWQIVLEKAAALLLFTLLVAVVAVALGFTVGALLGGVDDYPLGKVVLGAFNMVPLILFFASLALCLTGLRRGRGLALGGVLGIAAATYLIDSIAQVIDDIPSWMQYLSPWYYYGGRTVMQDGMNVGYVALLLGLSALLVALGLWGFERRDVGV